MSVSGQAAQANARGLKAKAVRIRKVSADGANGLSGWDRRQKAVQDLAVAVQGRPPAAWRACSGRRGAVR